jgi:23S rRNA (uridine2552-2'-O)-methyltransferase
MVAAAARKGVTDFFAKEAKRLGYVARSALKLSEMQEKFAVVQKGGAVLDLGCHPGAWLQVACKALGPPQGKDGGGGGGGVVFGVDLTETDTDGMRFVDDRVATVQRDVFKIDGSTVLGSLQGESSAMRPPRYFTTVLSDMAPSTTGNAVMDAARSYELAEAAVRLALGEAALDVLDDDDDEEEEEEGEEEVSNKVIAAGTNNDNSGGGGMKNGLLRRGGNLVIKLLEGPGGGRQDLQTVGLHSLMSASDWLPGREVEGGGAGAGAGAEARAGEGREWERGRGRGRGWKTGRRRQGWGWDHTGCCHLLVFCLSLGGVRLVTWTIPAVINRCLDCKIT